MPSVAAEMEPFTFHLHSWRSFFLLLRLPPDAVVAAYAVASIATCIVALLCWRASGPLVLRYSVLLLATILVDPHMYTYDMVLLAPAFLLSWDWALAQRGRRVGDVFPSVPLAWLRTRSFSASVEWLLYFCYMSPLFAIVAAAFRVQLSVVALALLGGVLSAVLLSGTRRAVAESAA